MSQSKEVFRGVTGADLAALGLVLALCSPWIAVVVLGKWEDVSRWCGDHGILVAEDDNPLVTLPKADGMGLDAARLVIGAVAVLTLLVIVWYLRLRWRMFRRARYEWRAMGRP